MVTLETDQFGRGNLPPAEHIGVEPVATPNSSMEQVVKKLGDEYGVDLSQPGAQLRLDMPTKPDRWMIANLGGQILLARAFEQEDGTLSPDLELSFAIGGVGGFDAPIDRMGSLPNDPIGPKEPHQNLTPEGGKLTEGENLSPAAYWTLDFMYNLGYTVYLTDRAEMRGFNLAEGLEELRSRGILDETDPERPKVRKEQLHEDFSHKLEEEPFIEREEREGGTSLVWGERLTKDGLWVLDYLHVGYSQYIRGVAEMDGIDLDAGLEELRRQGLLDENNPEYLKLKPGIP